MSAKDMDNTSDHRARLVVVERGLDELKGTVSDLARSINKYISEQSKAPRPIPFKEIVITAVSTLTLFSGILAFMDSRTADKIAIASQKDVASQAVMQYRMDQLEKKISPPISLVKPIQ